MACPMRGFHVDDILDAIHNKQQQQQRFDSTATHDTVQDKAEQLVRRLGEGDFRSELSAFPDAVRSKKIFTFTELRRTQAVTQNSGRVKRDGDAVMAAVPNSVILGLPGDHEEVIPADKDHSSIVKFDSRSDETYEDVVCRMQQILSGLGTQSDSQGEDSGGSGRVP
jgi:hypothetical protein